MTTQTFDAAAILETYRTAFAPALAAQQEAFKSVERLVRYQYALAGDYLEWSLAQAQALAAAKSPAKSSPSRPSSAPRSASSCAAACRNSPRSPAMRRAR